MKTLLLLIHIGFLFLIFGLLLSHWGLWIYANNSSIEMVYGIKFDGEKLELQPPTQRFTVKGMSIRRNNGNH